MTAYSCPSCGRSPAPASGRVCEDCHRASQQQQQVTALLADLPIYGGLIHGPARVAAMRERITASAPEVQRRAYVLAVEMAEAFAGLDVPLADDDQHVSAPEDLPY